MGLAFRIIRVSAVVAVLLATGSLLWPATLGGSTSYLGTRGNSMAPSFATGDLAIVRPSSSYAVGDVVAYDSPGLGEVVMHRIVDREGDRFVTQGDNNDFLDPDRPTGDELLGALVVRVPQGGRALAAVTSPPVLAAVAVASMLLVGVVRRPPGGRHSGRQRRRPPLGSPLRVLVTSLADPVRARQALVGAGSTVLVAAAGGGLLLLVPDTETESASIPVTQQGRFAYTGEAPAGTTYPTGRVGTGDPVYTRLVDDLTVSFEDTISGPGLTELAGTVHLEVRLVASDGWSAVVGRGPAAPFTDGTATASVAVDADAARSMLAAHHDEVGAAGSSASLRVSPVVEASGALGGQPVRVDPPGSLDFTMDAVALRPSPSAEDGLAPRTESAVTVEDVVPGSLDVVGIEVPVGTARAAVGSLLVLALLGLGVVAVLGGPIGDDSVALRRSTRRMPVAALPAGDAVVEMTDATTLLRLADRVDGLVLHQEGPDADTYAVQHAGTTYRLITPPVPAPVRRPAAATGAQTLRGRVA